MRKKRMRLLVCPEAWRQFGATRQERAVNLAALSRRGDLRALVAEGREMSPSELLQTRATTVFADVVDSFSGIDLERGWRVAPSWAAGCAVLAAVRHAASSGDPVGKFLTLPRYPGQAPPVAIRALPWLSGAVWAELMATQSADGIWSVFLVGQGGTQVDLPGGAKAVELWPDLSVRLLDYGLGRRHDREYAPKALGLAVGEIVEAARGMIKG
jgi:hypothetical protein